MVLLKDPSSSLSFRWTSSSSSCSYQSNLVFVSGRISPQDFDVFSISPQQTYSFRCWFFQQPRSNLLLKMFFQAHWRWYYVILDNLSSCFMIHMLLRMRYFKSINLVIGVTLGYVSPKTFPKDFAIYGAHKWPKFLFILPMNKFLVFLFLSIQYCFH